MKEALIQTVFSLDSKTNFMMKKPERLVICGKDIMRIYGVSKTTAWRQMQAIRNFYNKVPKASISLDEFCSFHQLKKEDVINFLY
jgi:hypothetical protein